MPSKIELAIKYSKKFKPTLFDSGIGARLPPAYRKFYDEWRNTPPQPVHYNPDERRIWYRTEDGQVKRREDIPLPTRFPAELHSVFTGGEVVVQGFTHKFRRSRIPKFWVPRVYRSVIYSEILDKHLSTLMTKRAVELIHKHQGLDSYLLETKACDLGTLVSLRLKKALLLALSKNDLPYDSEKNKAIFQKYEKFLIPPEELEWYGLTYSEACQKLRGIEETEILKSAVPLKQVYRAELIEELKEGKYDMPKQVDVAENLKTSAKWIKKITGFGKDTRKS